MLANSGPFSVLIARKHRSWSILLRGQAFNEHVCVSPCLNAGWLFQHKTTPHFPPPPRLDSRSTQGPRIHPRVEPLDRSVLVHFARWKRSRSGFAQCVCFCGREHTYTHFYPASWAYIYVRKHKAMSVHICSAKQPTSQPYRASQCRGLECHRIVSWRSRARWKHKVAADQVNMGWTLGRDSFTATAHYGLP